MKLPSTAIFRGGVKGKQRPFGLQLCASHGCIFAWHFRCGVIRLSGGFWVCLVLVFCDVIDLRRGSRTFFKIKQADEIRPDRHAFLPS